MPKKNSTQILLKFHVANPHAIRISNVVFYQIRCQKFFNNKFQFISPNIGNVRKALPEAVGGSILALDQNFAKKSCSPKSWQKFQLIKPIFGNLERWIIEKIAKIGNVLKNQQKLHIL